MADRSSKNATARLGRTRPDRAYVGRRGLLRRFARAQEGATAVEFAFVAIPFLILVIGLFELGLTFLVSMTLENGLMNVDRRIRTGELQTAGASAATYRAAVCDQMSWLGSGCSSALIVDVRTLPSFSTGAALATPKATKTCWDPGGPSSIVLVRAYYKWPLITPLLQSAIGGSPGDRQINFAAVFANEPYSETPAQSVTCP